MAPAASRALAAPLLDAAGAADLAEGDDEREGEREDDLDLGEGDELGEGAAGVGGAASVVVEPRVRDAWAFLARCRHAWCLVVVCAAAATVFASAQTGAFLWLLKNGLRDVVAFQTGDAFVLVLVVALPLTCALVLVELAGLVADAMSQHVLPRHRAALRWAVAAALAGARVEPRVARPAATLVADAAAMTLDLVPVAQLLKSLANRDGFLLTLSGMFFAAIAVHGVHAAVYVGLRTAAACWKLAGVASAETLAVATDRPSPNVFPMRLEEPDVVACRVARAGRMASTSGPLRGRWRVERGGRVVGRGYVDVTVNCTAERGPPGYAVYVAARAVWKRTGRRLLVWAAGVHAELALKLPPQVHEAWDLVREAGSRAVGLVIVKVQATSPRAGALAEQPTARQRTVRWGVLNLVTFCITLALLLGGSRCIALVPSGREEEMCGGWRTAAAVGYVAFQIVAGVQVVSFFGQRNAFVVVIALFGGISAIMLGALTYSEFALADPRPPCPYGPGPATPGLPGIDRCGVPERLLDQGYGVCSIRARLAEHELSVLDFALMSKMTYLNTDEQRDASLAHWFPGWTVQASRTNSTITSFFEFTSGNASVVAVRGTSSGREIISDLQGWYAVVTLSCLDFLLPFVNVLPEDVVVELVRWTSMFDRFLQPFYYDPLEYVKGRLADDPTLQARMAVTGHSLGGAVANILAASSELRSSTYSPPGVFFGRAKFHIGKEELNALTASVLPEHDPLWTVDKQAGLNQRIFCPARGVACHNIDRTICTLALACAQTDRDSAVACTYCSRPTPGCGH